MKGFYSKLKPKWKQIFFSSLYWGHQRLPVKRLRTQENEHRKVSLMNGWDKKVSPIQVISLTFFAVTVVNWLNFGSVFHWHYQRKRKKPERCTLGCLLKTLKLNNILKEQAMNVHVNRVTVNFTNSPVSFFIVADKAWHNLPLTLTQCYVWYKTFRAKAVSWKIDLFFFQPAIL